MREGEGDAELRRRRVERIRECRERRDIGEDTPADVAGVATDLAVAVHLARQDAAFEAVREPATSIPAPTGRRGAPSGMARRETLYFSCAICGPGTSSSVAMSIRAWMLDADQLFLPRHG